jgi:hypothetical protein
LKNLILAFLITSSFGIHAQTGARVADLQVKKNTGIVEHTAFSKFYQFEYRNLNVVLENVLKKYGCYSKAKIEVIKEPGLFSKGKFIGSFYADCFNKKIKDINLFFEVYPYDEESAAVVEVIFKDGKREIQADCWNFRGNQIYCSPEDMIGASGFNFKN